MSHKFFCLSVYAVLVCFFVGSQAQPKLSGYAQEIDFGSRLTTSADQPFPFYLTYYFTVNNGTLYGGGVTNYTGWVAWALSQSGQMYIGGFSDAIASYYQTSTSTMFLKDLSLSQRTPQTQAQCATLTGVCADEDKNGCTNNVELVSSRVNGSYTIFEFTRPTAATDANCDRSVPISPSLGYVIGAAGPMGSGTALPYSMQQHTYRTTTGFQVGFLTGNVPSAATTTGSTVTTTTDASTSGTSSTVSTSSSSSTGTGTTGTTGGTTTGTTGSVSTTTGGTTSGSIQCTKDISAQCLETCAPQYVDYCRCNITTNTLVYICKDTFVLNAAGSVAPTLLVLILGLLALFQ